ncbi:hypothetical protein FAES_3649 [Fibrella aestuarina BUZ 2]|uniref:Uncharacterized protein n=1 Tax=Fibrella aestuarina BUZ 2 TaxID=1166018 RepID=I0KC03_9BACT|nr:hypothetical protein [Fibrella aestuarina]CCH01656.1 hypothetical protein FAES_3649 [Fibrella aestuarina BUZ 2]
MGNTATPVAQTDKVPSEQPNAEAQAALTAQLATLEGQLATVNQQSADQQTKIEQLSKQLGEALQLADKKEQQLSEVLQLVDEQGETIANQDLEIKRLRATPDALPSFVLDKTVYTVDCRQFTWKKTSYEVADLVANKALQKELVKAGVGFIKIKEQA